MRAHQPERLGHDFIQDPHTLYERLRVEGPAHPIIMWGGLRAWLVTGYVEAKALLTDPRLGKDHFRALRLFPPGTAGPHASPLAANMLHADPPDHTRLRRLVNKAFAVRAVAHLRPRIELIADELLQNVDTTSSVDLMQSFALPLPIRVISSLLGVPKADRDKFADWTEPFIGNASPDKLQWAHNELAAYLGALIAAKRVEPTDDLLTELVRTSEDGDRLSEQELLAMAFLLIMAGYETTVNLIGNSVFALLRDPPQLAALRADPALIPGAVEEFLRFESPLNIATTRFTTAPVQVGEVEIPADEFVMIALLSANHDDGQFHEPDQLDVARKANAHLAFGHGIHYCVGAPLARLEGEIALGRLLHRFDTITLDDRAPAPRYRISTLMRGLDALPVRLSHS